MKVQHPDFPDLVRDVSNGKSWLAAGWLRLDTDTLSEPTVIVVEKGAEVFIPEPCPTCGAVGPAPCVTSAGNETSRHAKRA